LGTVGGGGAYFDLSRLKVKVRKKGLGEKILAIVA